MTLQCSEQLSQWPGDFLGWEASNACVFSTERLSQYLLGSISVAPVRNTQIHLASVLTQQDKGTEGYAPKGHLPICRQLSGNAHQHM